MLRFQELPACNIMPFCECHSMQSRMGALSMNANHAGYYRFPTIHADNIAFVSDDDLWQVSRSRR